MILSRFPVEDVLRCKEVCKTWRNLLSHIERDQKINLLFAVRHKYADKMKFYYGEYDEKNKSKKINEQLSFNALTPLIGCPYINYREVIGSNFRPMVGSCRGLVCLYETHDNVQDPTYICNPFNKETIFLPRLHLGKDSNYYDRLVSGFGYLYATNEYKVVRIHYNQTKFRGGRVQVYTLGDKIGWRNKEDITSPRLSTGNGILCDGALHWLNEESKVVAFDLADEEFRSVRSPPCFQTDWRDRLQLMLLRGYLSIVHRIISCGKTTVWSFKETENSNGRKDWTQEFPLGSDQLFDAPGHHPLALTEESRFLLWHRHDSTLCHYDHQTGILEKIVYEDAGKRFQDIHAIPYMKCDDSLTVLEPHLPVVYWE